MQNITNEFIKGIPLQPDEKDIPEVLDKLDMIFWGSDAWILFRGSPVMNAVRRYYTRQGERDAVLWSIIYAFSIGLAAGKHQERERRRKG